MEIVQNVEDLKILIAPNAQILASFSKLENAWMHATLAFFPDPNQKCIKCHYACADCDNSGYEDVCSACSDGYFKEYLGLSCYDTCVKGTYPDTFTNECVKCHYTCKECNGANADNCISCKNSYYEEDGLCKVACSPGRFIVDKSCRTCDPSCSVCTGILNTECNACNNGWFLLNSTCLTECPKGYYGDTSENACYPCL